MGSPPARENIATFEKRAGSLGAVLWASRLLADGDWMPRGRQMAHYGAVADLFEVARVLGQPA